MSLKLGSSQCESSLSVLTIIFAHNVSPHYHSWPIRLMNLHLILVKATLTQEFLVITKGIYFLPSFQPVHLKRS